jgi:hypothetical protein
MFGNMAAIYIILPGNQLHRHATFSPIIASSKKPRGMGWDYLNALVQGSGGDRTRTQVSKKFHMT